VPRRCGARRDRREWGRVRDEKRGQNGIRDASDPRRTGARCRDGRRDVADLRDLHLRPDPARRDSGLRLHALGQPQLHAACDDARLPRRGSFRHCIRERHGCDYGRDLDVALRRSRARRGERLRLHLPDLRPGLREVRRRGPLRRPRRSGELPARRRAATGPRLARVSDESDAQDPRHRRDLGARGARGCARAGRQYLRLALLPAAPRARRHALALEHDEIREWPLGLSGRRRPDQ
jgi:hypothetical protein